MLDLHISIPFLRDMHSATMGFARVSTSKTHAYCTNPAAHIKLIC